MAPPYTTLAAAQADYLAYSGYEYNGGVASAEIFVQAAQALMVLRPDAIGNQGSTLAINNRTLQSEIDRARIYVYRMTRLAGGVKVLGTDSSFRGRAFPLGNDDPLEAPT